MPRIPRVVVPGLPHHITQRGNNRARVFFDDDDRQVYLQLLTNHARKHALQVQAYCLMDNHVHLLAVPETENSLARGIGLTNQIYTQYLNGKLDRSGRVWQNRFFSCVVGDERYLWAVARYIERNPVKAGLVARAEDYRWSSAGAHLTGTVDLVVLASSWLDSSEKNAYAEFVRDEDRATEEKIRKATRSGRPFGSEGFVAQLEHRLQRALRPGRAGRPRKYGECP